MADFAETPGRSLWSPQKLAQALGQRDSYFGYKVRPPYHGESQFFSANPNVSGMAAEDGQITFNPYSQNINRDSVGQNEAARLWMRENNFAPNFEVSQPQTAQFSGTPYENNPDAMRQTLLARIISGDPSAGNASAHQLQIAEFLRATLESRNKMQPKSPYLRGLAE